MKDKFIDLFTANINRPGAEKLLALLESSDFFTAPASTKYHSAKEGGLCEHSLNVYKRLLENYIAPSPKMLETITICGLLHDLCKVNFYTITERNVKNDEGKWIKEPFYAVDEKFPFGHGEKSVFLIERFMRLTEEEAIAIRFHMGSTGYNDFNAAGKAFELYPLSLYLHIADLMAAYLDEKA